MLVVAGQVAVVGALLLVVYLTLLRPEEQKPLFGVGAQPGSGALAQAQGGGAAGGTRGGLDGAGGGPGGRHGGGRGGNHPGAQGPGGSSAVSGSAVGGQPALPVPIRDGGGTPTATPSDEQYQDTVSRLFGNL
jgi:hypothetical protein